MLRYIVGFVFLFSAQAAAQQDPQAPAPNALEQRIITEIGQLRYSLMVLESSFVNVNEQLSKARERIRELEAKQQSREQK